MATMSNEQLMAMLEQLAKDNAELKAKLAAKAAPKALTVMVGKHGKGNVCVYGLGRFPVTLYAGQWLRLAELMGEVVSFIDEHKATLAWKSDDGVVTDHGPAIAKAKAKLGLS